MTETNEALLAWPVPAQADSVVVSCIIPGEPLSKQRPRFSGKHVYNPTENRRAQENIALFIRTTHRSIVPDEDNQFGVRISFFMKSGQRIYAKRDGASKPPDRSQTTVWEVDKPHDSQHPTQKPVELFVIPIRNHTKKGDVVFDPFCGSGTVLCASEILGRNGFGVEIEPKYVALSLERLSEMGLYPQLRKSTKRGE